jgi:S1-C subfamily serine protease
MSAMQHDYGAPPRSRNSCLAPLILLVLAVAILAWRFWPFGSGLNSNAQPRAVLARGDLASAEKTNIEVYEKCSPSVVQVTNLTAESGGGLFGLDIQKVPKGVGSGFVWDEDGHIVTNYHVVEGADAAKVTLADHSTYDAKQIWGDAQNDIAVIWIAAPRNKLHPITIGTSHDLKVGQITFALGDPFGLDQTMTSGIISAMGRQIEGENGRVIRGLIQTSAPINPGNSGGPLLDSAGRLIGMNTAILSPSGASAGIGFAIPVDEINRIVPQLIQHGKVIRPRLGVQIAEDQLAQRLGIESGALVIKVVPDSAAAKAGLKGTTRDESGRIQLGDVIVAVDQTKVENGKDLHAAIEAHKVGDTVTLTIMRNGQEQHVQVTLQAE